MYHSIQKTISEQMEKPETNATKIETEKLGDMEPKPGFLCFPVPNQSQGSICNCEIPNSCPNVHCIIKSHLQDRPNTRMTDEVGMIMVPIQKFGEKHDHKTSTETDNVRGETEAISRTRNIDTTNLFKEIDELVQAKLLQMTKLTKPTTMEELAILLQATESDEFKGMLVDKLEEIADSENGAEKVKLINEHFKSSRISPIIHTELMNNQK